MKTIAVRDHLENQNKPQFENSDASLDAAKQMDLADALRNFREEFVFPKTRSDRPILYFAGHSLGLMPKKTPEYVHRELDDWGHLAVEGHFKEEFPWLSYHEFLAAPLARLVGAQESEVVAMNSLTVNLHLMLVSFYRPSQKRYKILIENNTFPSDRYAVESQIRFHGLDPKDTLVELQTEADSLPVSPDSILKQINDLGDSLSLVMLGQCNYLSGQRFHMADIAHAAHDVGAFCGFNLAHGAGNLKMNLHDDNIDFAVWCSYKYLNSGPGGIAGAFVHQKHHEEPTIPRLHGWWGHDKSSRFKMPANFRPIPTVESWQLSNPPILQLAALRSSLEIFDRAKIENLEAKSEHLTGYFRWLIENKLQDKAEVLTPIHDRGAMLCMRFHNLKSNPLEALSAQGVVADFRQPNIIRATPAPLYNSYEDVFQFVDLLERSVND